MTIEPGEHLDTVYIQLLDTDLTDLKISGETIKKLESLKLDTLHLKFQSDAKLVGFPILCSFIRANQNLNVLLLDFEAKDLCASDLAMLCYAIAKMPALKEIYLPRSLNLLEEECFTTLSNALFESKTLNKWNIGGTPLETCSDSAFDKISELILQCQPTVLEISTDFNLFSQTRFDRFCNVLTQCQIQYLTGAYEQSEEQGKILYKILDANKTIVKQKLHRKAQQESLQTIQEIVDILDKIGDLTKEAKQVGSSQEPQQAEDKQPPAYTKQEDKTQPPAYTKQYDTLVKAPKPKVTNTPNLAALITSRWY